MISTTVTRLRLSRSEFLRREANLKLVMLGSFYLVNVFMATDTIAVLITLPIFVIVAYNIARIRSVYLTPFDVFWFMVFLFFVIRPCQAIHGGHIGSSGLLSRLHFSESQIIYAALIIGIFLAAFTVGTHFFKKRSSTNQIFPTHAINYESSFRTLLLVTFICFVGYVVTYGGLQNVLAPRWSKVQVDVQYLPLLLLGIFSVSVAFSVAKLVAMPRKTLGSIVIVFVSLLLLLILQNPFNTPRFFLVATWFPVVLAVLHGRVRSTIFYVSTIGAVLFIFPLLSISTRLGFEGYLNLPSATSSTWTMELPYIDAFDTMVAAVRYMEHHSLAYGAKAVAIVLFFVPRAIWPDKPIVGGLDIGGGLYEGGFAGTPNLSFFVAGDFWMDMGLPGVVLGALILGYVFRLYTAKKDHLYFGQDVAAYIWISSIPILVRGPLGAVISLFACQIGALWLFTFIARKTSINHKLIAGKSLHSPEIGLT